MEGATLSFRIIEPMMFRGPGEFDPFVRGAYSRALTLLLPTPSTVAGALATYCISKFNRQIPTVQSWTERYVSVLGNDIKIKGPILSVDNYFFVEDKCSNVLLSLEELKKKCKMEYEKINEIKSLTELDEYLKLEKFEPSIKVERDVRIGIGLQLREKESLKMAKDGWLYTAEYIDYKTFSGRREASAEILADVKGYLVERLLKQKPTPVKLGGETRISLAEFHEGNRIFNKIKSVLWCNEERHDGVIALYLATPALFKGGRRVLEYVKDWVDGMGYKFRGIVGESEILGAGYALMEKKRKPVYTSLKPGSIIYLEGDFELQNTYWNASIGEATSIGYGTTLPYPL